MPHILVKFKTIKITSIKVILISEWKQKLNWDNLIKNEEQLINESLKIIDIDLKIEIT